MRNKQEQWTVLKRLLSYLKPYGLLTFLALAFLLATTVIKSVIPLVASHFIDQYLNNLNQLAVTVLLVYYGLYILQTIVQYVGNLFFARVSYSIVRDIRRDAFIQYINRLFDPLIEVTQNFSTLQTSMVSAGRVFALIDESSYEPVQENGQAEIQEGNIRFEHVSFSYDGKHQILNDISFTVNKGETIAFVGHTGSGKSSIINVLMRFYEFQSGRVLIDGVDIREYSQEALRKNIGLVLQEPFLYHGTIKSNIAMYQDISDDQVKAAAEFVDADSFIQDLPLGYDAPVSERGSSFSTGQRQLLAFARTVASQPKILILDEATANIDSETEALVQNSLAKMRQGRTTIAIAHRLSTIQDANCIYVLDKGRIIESGTHEELLALGGTYHKMYSLQAGALS